MENFWTKILEIWQKINPLCVPSGPRRLDVLSVAGLNFQLNQLGITTLVVFRRTPGAYNGLHYKTGLIHNYK